MVFWSKPKTEQPVARALDARIARAADSIQKSPFSPPDFLRRAWVSEAARVLHEPRIDRAAEAWRRIEIYSATRARPCALSIDSATDLPLRIREVESAGAVALALRVEDVAPPGASEPVLVTHTVAGARRDVDRFRRAWIAADADAIGAMLGYPACCRAFFGEMFVKRGFNDPAWLIGLATPGARVEDRRVSVSGPREVNILLRVLGVRAVPHLPCSFACSDSIALSRAMTELARTLGCSEEIELLGEMLDWSVAWSARHGVLEVRTPVLKFATRTDATAEEFQLCFTGGTIPEHGARGLVFPYLGATT